MEIFGNPVTGYTTEFYSEMIENFSHDNKTYLNQKTIDGNFEKFYNGKGSNLESKKFWGNLSRFNPNLKRFYPFYGSSSLKNPTNIYEKGLKIQKGHIIKKEEKKSRKRSFDTSLNIHNDHTNSLKREKKWKRNKGSKNPLLKENFFADHKTY